MARNNSLPLAHLLVAAFLALAGPALGQTVTFQGLGALPGADTGSRAADLSADGSVAVGGSAAGSTVFEAWRWTSAGAMQGLGFLPGESSSSAHAVSSNGQFVGGASGSKAFRWSSGGGFVPIDDGMPSSGVAGVSDDGNTLVGGGYEYPAGNDVLAWRWRSGSGFDLTFAGDLLEGWDTFVDLSPDGSTILGSSDIFDDSLPYLHTSIGKTYIPVFLPLDVCQCGDPVLAMTPDASVVVGIYQETEAYRWDVVLGEGQLLGYLDPTAEWESTFALGVSSDGLIVVGRSFSSNGEKAFIWSEEKGMQRISAILESNGVDLSDWQLEQAVAVSADGTIILGNGTRSSGTAEAWIATIPASAWSPLTPSAPALDLGPIVLLVLLLLAGGIASTTGLARGVGAAASASTDRSRSSPRY